MSKRKKTSVASPPIEAETAAEGNESVTTRAAVPSEVLEAMSREIPVDEAEPASAAEESGEAPRAPAPTEHNHDDVEAEAVVEAEAEPQAEAKPEAEEAEAELELAPSNRLIDANQFDAEMTVNLVGELPLPGRDDLDAPTVTTSGEVLEEVDSLVTQRKHLRGLLESLVFASDSPIKPKELAKLASANVKQVSDLLVELQLDYSTRGIHLDEVAGGWVFRTSPKYAPFVRDLTKQKPVRLTRAQVETLAIIAYRQPITRPEIDDVRGVDSGPVLKLLLERDLVRILGKRDEPGRPIIYGTTGQFLEFFGLKSLKDLPTLREFTELSDESREAFEDELGETPEGGAEQDADAESDDDGGLGVHESAPADEALEDLGEEALEALADLEREQAAEDEEELADAHDAHDAHVTDDDGPTLTSEAPTLDDEDDDA